MCIFIQKIYASTSISLLSCAYFIYILSTESFSEIDDCRIESEKKLNNRLTEILFKLQLKIYSGFKILIIPNSVGVK